MRSVNADQLKKVLQGLPKNPRVLVSGNFGTLKTLLALFDQIVPEYTLHMLNAQPGIPNRPGVTHETAFVGAGMRGSDRLNYIPSRLSLLPVMLRDHLVPDVVLIHTSSLRFDTVSLGIEVNILPAAIEAARERGGIVIAQSNSNMPYTYGDSQIYENEIDFIFEQDEELNCHTPVSIPESAKEIGRRVANLVPSGSTLQLGIGSVPDAVLELMTERKDLRIWTEMFSDGVTSFQHSFVVTEQGIAECFGHDESEQAKNLIEKAAHPNARTSLREAATRMGL